MTSATVDHRFRHNRTRLHTAVAGVCLMGALWCAGCDDSSGATTADGSGNTVTADTYEVVFNEPGTPLQGDLEEWVKVTNRMGFTTSFNVVDGLELTDKDPRQVISGRQTFKGSSYVRSRVLRIEQFLEPTGSKMVQVDVSLSGPLALKEVTAEERGQYIPAPVLIDNIGNAYWASGYLLTDSTSGQTKHTVQLDRGKQLKNLNDIPRLSVNKPQDLKLLYYVNKGVTITSVSYGGQQPKYTFELAITGR